MNSLILDVLIILIFSIFLIAGFRSGIIKSFLSFTGAIFSVFFSVYFADMLSRVIYSNFIEPSLIKKIGEALTINHANANQLFNKLPKFILNYLPSYGITPSSVNHIINSSNTNAIPARISVLFAPIIINAFKSLLVVILFIVFLIFMRILSKLILKVFKVSVLKNANTFLGGIFGLFKGYIAVAVCMCCLKVLIPSGNNISKILSEESISYTVVFKELYNNNPVYELFKSI